MDQAIIQRLEILLKQQVEWCVIDKEGTNLFRINYVPPIGSTLHYCMDWNIIGDLDQYAEHTIERWKSIDGKYWTVVDVCCEVRNFSRDGRLKEVPVSFVKVVEKASGEP